MPKTDNERKREIAREQARALFVEVFGPAKEQRIVNSGDPLCRYCQRRRAVDDVYCGRRMCRVQDEKRAALARASSI